MCGLVAVVSKYTNGFTQKQKDLFSTLLFIDTLRGNDSTGVFLMDNQGSLHLSKEATAASEFMAHKDYDELMRTAIMKGSVLVGHNRKATKGTINDANAHPFLVDDKICLVHNGTLWGDHKQHADVDVDSHAIAHLIAKEGAEKAINTINGAFALIWHNFEENTISFLRNSQRPLYWVETPNEFIWSSEVAMIEFACARNDILLTNDPQMLKEHTICQYKLDPDKKTLDLENIPVIIHAKTHTAPASDSRPGWPGQESWDGYNACGYESDYMTQWKHRGNSYYQNNGYVGKDISAGRAKLLIAGVGDTAVTQAEMEDCTMQANLVNADEFRDIAQKYQWGTEVKAYSYAATCVNEVDDSDGMFLWLTVYDDPAILVRHRYQPGEVTKDYLEELAKAGMYYNCQIDHKAWQRVDGYVVRGQHVGFVIMTASNVDICEKPTVENLQSKEVVSVQ